MIKFFDSYEYFVRCIKEFEKYFMQCKNCGFVWLNPQVDYGARLSEEEFILLQKCLVDVNNWCPEVPELADAGIELSHGVCPLCFREAYRERARGKQRAEGNPECYGRANDGHCDRFDCKWRHTYHCVATRPAYEKWRSRVSQLLEVMTLEVRPEFS